MGLKTTVARARWTAIGIVLVVAVAACGSGDDTSDAPGGATADDGEVAAQTGETDSDDAEAGGTDDEQTDDEQTDDEQPAAVLTASDGWSELHGFDLPAPGTAELTVDGQTFVADVTCQGAGEVPDHFMDGNRQLNEFIIFNFLMTGTGQVGDNPPFRVHIERGIWIDGDRWLNLQHANYGGDGQFDVVSLSGGSDGVSRVQSPSSDDPDGALLPLVHVDPSGGVTAEGELSPEFEGDTAPSGPFTLAAQCQEGWPDDVIDAVG